MKVGDMVEYGGYNRSATHPRRVGTMATVIKVGSRLVVIRFADGFEHTTTYSWVGEPQGGPW